MTAYSGQAKKLIETLWSANLNKVFGIDTKKITFTKLHFGLVREL